MPFSLEKPKLIVLGVMCCLLPIQLSASMLNKFTTSLSLAHPSVISVLQARIRLQESSLRRREAPRALGQGAAAAKIGLAAAP